jgi:ATP synthase protein I
MFGVPSVQGGDSLAKNFTSARFQPVNEPPKGPVTPEPGSRKPLSSGSEFAGMGLQIGATFALSAWLGYWLDGRFQTLPWLTILFVFLGAGAAFYHVYHRVFGHGGR